MAVNNVMKLIAMIMVLELILIATATHIDDGHDHEFNISPTCILTCGALCKDKGWQTPVCFAKCLVDCKLPPVVSDDVALCTSACAQSDCSKFVESDINTLEECVINDCLKGCIARSGN